MTIDIAEAETHLPEPELSSLQLNMKVFDNINHLPDASLKQTIKPGTKLKIAASCFSIYAYDKN